MHSPDVLTASPGLSGWRTVFIVGTPQDGNVRLSANNSSGPVSGPHIRAIGAAGQRTRLITGVSLVRIQHGPPRNYLQGREDHMPRDDFSPDVLRQRICQLRKERGLGRRAFSRLIGSTTGSNVLWWERGERIPSAYYIFRIAWACDVSADWLLGLTDERRDADYGC